MKKTLISLVVISMAMGVFGQSSMYRLGVQLKKELIHKQVPKPAGMYSRSGISYDTMIVGPVVNFSGTQILDKLSFTLSNTTAQPIQFTLADLPQNDSQYVADYFLAAVTHPLDSAQAALEVDSAATAFLKNYLHYKNDQLIFNGSWSDSVLFSREHSLIGRVYSTGSTQCGNSNIHGNILGMKSGYFNKENFRLISVPGHSTNEIIIGYDTIYADRDVGTIGYMFKDPNNPGKRYSYMELREDTLRINEKYLLNGVDPHLDNTLSEYRELLMGPYMVGPMNWTRTVSIDGRFILPAHSSFEITLPVTGLFIDLADSVTVALLMDATAIIDIADSVQYAGSFCDWCVDSVQNMLRRTIPCRPEIADSLLRGYSVSFNTYHSSNDAGKNFNEVFLFDCPREIIPTITLAINQNPDTLRVGTDVKAPLFILETHSPLMLDGIQLPLPFIPQLWSSGDTPPNITSQSVHYLDSGWLAPGPHTINLSYNWNLLSLYKPWYFSGGQGLTFNRVEEWCSLPTGIAEVAPVNKGRLVGSEYYNYLGQRTDPTAKGLIIQVLTYEYGRETIRTYRE